MDQEIESIQAMIHCRLNDVAALKAQTLFAVHPDEDTLAAFVERVLAENQTGAIVSHLVACGSCRDLTARLIQLESSFAYEEPAPVADTTSRLRRFLEELMSQVVPSSGEDAVFAYHNPDEKTEKSDEQSADTPKDDS